MYDILVLTTMAYHWIHGSQAEIAPSSSECIRKGGLLILIDMNSGVGFYIFQWIYS